MFAKRRSFFSALITIALSGAMSFSGTAGMAAVNSTPCPTGMTLTTVNSETFCQVSVEATLGTSPSASFTVPAGFTSFEVEVRGGAGGNGGSDAGKYGNGGAGSILTGTITVTPGQVIGLYAGGPGYAANDTNYALNALAGYDGGLGAHQTGGVPWPACGNSGYSGAGGGGGAASVIQVDGATFAVAGGGGGGGGGGQYGHLPATVSYSDGQTGVSYTSGTSGLSASWNYGCNQSGTPYDGGGGGGGGGGVQGGINGTGRADDTNGSGGYRGSSLSPAGLTEQATPASFSTTGFVALRFGVGPVVTASAAPTGSPVVFSTLTSAVTLQGATSQSTTWERSADGVTWTSISGANSATYALTVDDLGAYVRSVVSATNTFGTTIEQSPATTLVMLPAPTTPDLTVGSDTTPAGKSLTSDNVTSDKTPTISVGNLVTGASMVITATSGSLTKSCTVSPVANATESCTFDGANTLSAGLWSFSATQTLNSGSRASLSSLSDVRVDDVAPTATSVSIVPDLAVDKKVRISVTFSETLDSVDTTQILIGSTGTWTKSNPTVSGNTYSFDVVYTTLINDDITVAVGVGAATDVAGNVQTAARTFFEQVNTVNPSASYAVTPARLGSASTSTTMTLNFTRPVWGLTTSDFTWPATNGASCSLSSVTPSSGPASTYTLAATCTGAGTSTLRLAANAVKDFASVTGPAAAVDLTVIRDTTAPTITAITSNVVGSRVDYTVTFSEELSQFPSSAVSTAGATTASGTGTWTATTPARVGSTNQWTFSVSNSSAINGVYKPSFTVGGNIKDLSGNSLTVDPTITNASIVRLPTFAIGNLATPSSSAIAFAPNFDLSLYSGTMHGIKITNLDWSTSGTTKDAFSASLNSGNMGGSVTTNTSNGTIEILAPNATEAQWETAIRSIQFDAGTNSGARRFEFHLRPISGYIYSNEHYLILSSAASLLPAAITAASSSTYAGLQGYLATITSSDEDAWSMTTSRAAWISGSDEAVEGTWVHTAGPELGQTLSPTYWDTPPQQPDLAAEDCLVAYATGGYSGWHDVMCNLSNYYITEYGGMAGDPSVPSMKATASTTVDTAAPDVTSVRSTTANGTYVVGETISIQVNLDEATVVAGGTPRIKLNTSPTARYATYASGSGTSTLTFNYTIQAGDTAADLNYFDTASLELNGATLKDAAGNNAAITLDAINAATSLATASAIVIDADRFIAPTFSLGALPGIGPNPTAVAPNFNLTTRGAQPFGVLITNNSFDGSASVLDAFILNPVPAGVTVVANGSGEIELYGSTLTEAQWEAAIRAIQFDAGSSGVAPALTFHLRPLKAYDYETGHAYKYVASAAIAMAGAKTAAEALTLSGFAGYLANPTSAYETSVMTSNLTLPSHSLIGLQKNAAGTGANVQVKVVAPPAQVGAIAFKNWAAGESNLAGDMYLQMYADGTWNDFDGASNAWTAGYIVEFGGTAAGTNFLSTMTDSVNYVSDLTGPAVTNVSAITANGTLVAGDQVQIRVRFDDVLTVSGTPRLSLNMGANIRTADCVAGTPATDLICSYTVAQGDTSADLSYSSINALVLNGGSVTDSASNPAALTLPAIGAIGSLSRNSALVVNGNLNVLTLTAPTATDTDRNLVFTLTSSLPVDCSTLSVTNGVDFNFTGIDSIASVVASVNNKTCTINAVSSVLAGQYGTSSLGKASTFSIDDLQVSPVSTTALTVTAASIAVEVPAASGQGVVNRRAISGTPRTTFNKVAPPTVFDTLSVAAKNALVASNIISALNTAPIAEIEGDFSQATSRVEAKKKEQITAGDQVALSIKIDPSLVATHEVAAFFKSTVDPNNTGWTYLGKRDFDVNGLAVADPMTFVKRGTYYMKLIVVVKGTSFRTASVKPAAILVAPAPSAGKSSPLDVFNFRAAALLDSDLPTGVQTLEVAVEVTGTEPTVIDPAGNPAPPVAAPSTPSPTPTASPTPTPTPSPTVKPTPAPTVKPTPKPTSSASATPVVKPTPSVSPSVSPSASPSASPSPAKSPSASPAPAPSASAAAVALPSVENLISPTISIPEINPGEPVANPAIGATGDDSAPPVAFDPLGSPEAIAAVAETAATAVVVASSVAAAAAAAAGAAAGASAGASAGSSAGSSSGGSSSSSNSSSGNGGSGAESESADIGSLDVVQDDFEIEKSEWGDRLAWFAIPGMQVLDRLTHNLSLKLARFSPLFAKLVNDGSYLRAIIGTPTLLLSIAGAVLGVSGAIANDGAMLTPAWQALLAIAILGIFDAAAGFTAASMFITFSVVIAASKGIAIDMGDVRLMFGIMLLSIGPAMLTTAFRTLRKHPANDLKSWWERLTDFAVAPFMAGWSSFAMVSGLPALAGLTLAVANHVQDFALAIAAAALVRVGLEEFAARYYPARLNRINPDHLPEPPMIQMVVSLAIKYAVWIVVGGALIGEGWQLWVGSALFLVPTVIGWFQDKFPNYPAIWRILPSGVPGLALSLIVATVTTAVTGAILGAVPALASWSFVILPLPLLALSLLGMFARHGRDEDELKPAQRNVWVYRIGGVLMLVVTLKLAGVF